MKHQYDHPHPNPKHVMKCYRGHILGSKRKYGSSRGLMHHKEIIKTYLAAKELVINQKRGEPSCNIK